MDSNNTQYVSLIERREEEIEGQKRIVYQCKYSGTDRCSYICNKCEVMQLMLEKLCFFEDIEKELPSTQSL